MFICAIFSIIGHVISETENSDRHYNKIPCVEFHDNSQFIFPLSDLINVWCFHYSLGPLESKSELKVYMIKTDRFPFLGNGFNVKAVSYTQRNQK